MLSTDVLFVGFYFLYMLSFFNKLGFNNEVALLLAIIIYNLLKFIILCIIPLHKIERKK